MNRLKVVIILLALFFVVGQSCDLGKLGKKKTGIAEDDFKGTEGLVLNFVEGLPPKEVWKGIDFGIWIDAHNKGVNDIKNGRVCVGSLPSSIFTKSDSCLKLNEIAGRMNFPGGEIKTESGGQGAPIAVTSLKEDIVPRGKENELFFTLKIENNGDGEVIKREKINDEKCSFDRGDKNWVNIEVELPGFGKGNCKNDGKIVLVNGEGQGFCSGIKVPKGESFSLPLNIKLTYGYLSYIKGEFTIKKDILEAN